MQVISKLHHSVYCLHYHLVLVTKFREACLDAPMLARFKELASDAAERWGGTLLDANGEADHVHALLSLPPTVALADFVNNLKTTSSRLLRKEFESTVKQHYWKHKGLWSRSYCVISAGGASLEVLKQYVEAQNAPTR